MNIICYLFKLKQRNRYEEYGAVHNCAKNKLSFELNRNF